MTLQQALAFGLVVVTIGCFIWGRFRYDLISLAALLASVALGLVKPKNAFDGFSNDVVVIIACALVVSAGFARSGVIEVLLRPILPRLKSAATQVPVFAAATAVGAGTAVGSLIAFAATTIGTIVALTLIAVSGGYRLRGRWLERWANHLTAVVLVVVGVLVFAGAI